MLRGFAAIIFHEHVMTLPIPFSPAKADRFRHDGDQLIPGSGRRWSHVHRTKDAQPNAKAGRARQGERLLQSR